MPHRLVNKELSEMMSALAHPHRIQIIEELRDQELDVNSLQALLGISHSGVSQHLAILRSRRLVSERREGRHVFYRLTNPSLARWLLEGTIVLQETQEIADDIRSAIESVRAEWATPNQ